MRDRLRELYLNGDYNCAESLIMWANEKYGLDLPPVAQKMMAGYGGGMGCGKTCGALIGICGALSAMFIEDRAHTTKIFPSAWAKLVARFEAKLGGANCEEIRETHFTKEDRCWATVEIAADMLDKSIAELRG